MIINKSFKKCACHKAVCNKNHNILDNFLQIREKCPAIKEVFIPEYFICEFIDTVKNNKSRDDFMSLIAFEDGYLKNITRPVHKFLLDESGNKKPNVKIKLLESWIINYQTSTERNHKAKQQFLGPFHELLFADWLDENGYEIKDLQALGAKSDVMAENRKEKYTVNFEVKYIGYEEWFYDKLNNKNKSFSPCLLWQHDFLLYVAYEAAKQLSRLSRGFKVITILLQNSEHYDLDWIDWHSPHFHCIKRPFIDMGKFKSLNITNEVIQIFKQIDEIWFFKANYNFTYDFIKRIPIKNIEKSLFFASSGSQT